MTHSIHEQFLYPSEEFTPIPFWFWNDHLTKEEIRRQIHDFNEKGVNGFVLHPRIGIPKEIVYLSDYFMELVQTAVHEADVLGMTVILYDEAMYPSGSAKGMVVKDNPEYASRGLKMMEYPCNPGKEIVIDILGHESFVSAQAVEKLSPLSIHINHTQLLAVEDREVRFTPPNEGEWSILLFMEIFSCGTIRGINFGEDDGEENAPPSADLLNPDAVKKFIHLTHETYYSKLKDYFGNTVTAMFTDEPDILGRGSKRGLKPWTTDFLSFYKQSGNEEKHLPVLWFEAGEQTGDIRKDYQKTVNKKLTEAYYKQISEWCEDHQIALTGHPAASDDIGLLEHFQIPGQDVVWRWVAPEDGKALEGKHSTAGKCSADAARHRGRRRNLNEFLGVCGKESAWALSAGDMKWYIDWLLVRGVNLLCPHAFYYSIDGKRRSHERPPDVGPNNHWWPYYKQFAQYMKRLSWLMTDSTNDTAIAVLCEEDHLPWKIVKPLYENQVEFNYLEESLLQSSCVVDDGKIIIANQTYSVVIIEDSKHLEKAVIQKLEQFIAGGGNVIAYQKSPVNGAKIIETDTEIIEAMPIKSCDEVTLIPSTKSIRVSKVKKNGHFFYFFVNEGEESYEGLFQFKEKGKMEKWDPWCASITEVSTNQEGDKWFIPLIIPRRESIVYCLDPDEDPLVNERLLTETTRKKIDFGKWRIANAPVTIEESSLQSWLNWEGMESFSGTVRYENTFEMDEADSTANLYIDLGEVYEIAKVFINQKEVGVKMWAPYRLEIDKSFVENGTNTVWVEVTNNIANKMDHTQLKSGLIGAVRLELVWQRGGSNEILPV